VRVRVKCPSILAPEFNRPAGGAARASLVGCVAGLKAGSNELARPPIGRDGGHQPRSLIGRPHLAAAARLQARAASSTWPSKSRASPLALAPLTVAGRAGAQFR